MHIFLIGMAGAGKTSLGRKVAQNLNMPFMDTDQRITEMFGRSINEIFGTLGEPIFRNAETGVLMELASMPPTIVSTGGGLCVSNDNVTLMKNQGVIIHIDRPLDQILSDIRMEKRPNLAGGTPADVVELYNNRIGYYRAAADYRLDNSKGFVVAVRLLTDMIRSLE